MKTAIRQPRSLSGTIFLAGAAWMLVSSATTAAQGITLANPHWNITLTEFGYSDFLLDNTPGLEGREYLCGEWGAAVAYQVEGRAAVPPQWLEPQFLYPDWLTGSSFHVVAGFPATPTVNAAGLPIVESVIANGDLEITLRFEMLDTIVGTPMGLTPSSTAGAGAAIASSRYVLKQTATIRNLSGATVSNLQFFQFLHGLQSQRGVYDDRAHPGTLGEFQHDTTLAGVDAWASGPGSSAAGLEDYIGFHASVAPTAFEVGYYGIEGNGLDDHWSGKPTDGVHLSVEQNWQTPPFSTREGTDNFAPPQRWIAGAQRWALGVAGTTPLTLPAGQSVSLDVLLSVRTGTRVTPSVVSGGCNGGSSVPGGADYEFEGVSAEGSCFGEYTQADDTEIEVRVTAGEFGPLDFPLPAKPAQIWKLEFTGTFTGLAHLTVGYDPTILPPGFSEETLCLYRFDGVGWLKLAGTVDALANTISVTTSALGPLALGAGSITTYTVAASAAPAEGGTVTGDGTYVEGSSLSVVATPAQDYVFDRWSEGGGEVSTSPSYTFLVQANRTLVANFSFVGGGAHGVTTASLPAQGGATSGDGSYAPGSSATVTAVPAPGYKFSKWLEQEVEVSTANPFTFTVSGDRALVAKFKPVYTLTLTADGAGEVEGDPTYEPGDLVKLKATPADGHSFVNWTQNGLPVSTDPNFQFTMTGNRELVGHFAPGIRIDTSSIPPHAGTTSGGGVYDVDAEVGASVTVVAEPEPAYVFLSWTENGAEVSTAATYSFTTETGLALVANFGLPQEIAVEQPAGNELTDGLGVVSFGSAPATRTFTVRNRGDAELSGIAVTRDGPDAADFAVDTALMATTLAKGAETTFAVTFTPGGAGQRNATLHIASNDADENPFDIALTGNNTAPVAADPTYTRAPGLSLKIPLADLLSQCSDADADSLRVEGVGISAQGVRPDLTASHILYLPANDADDSFLYTINDGHGGTDSGTITVSVVVPGGLVEEIAATGGAVTVRFAGIPGYRYDIERAEDAGFTVNLQVLETRVAPRGPFTYTDPSPPQPMAFYRLKYNPAP